MRVQKKMASSTGTFTYWSLLGVNPGSNSDQLKQAFRREAKRWHPDLNRNNRDAEERFKWVNEAYFVLSDPRRRLEWELAGQPTIKLEKLPPIKQQAVSTQAACKPEINGNKFNSAEKLILVLISSLSLLFLNSYVL